MDHNLHLAMSLAWLEADRGIPFPNHESTFKFDPDDVERRIVMLEKIFGVKPPPPSETCSQSGMAWRIMHMQNSRTFPSQQYSASDVVKRSHIIDENTVTARSIRYGAENIVPSAFPGPRCPNLNCDEGKQCRDCWVFAMQRLGYAAGHQGFVLPNVQFTNSSTWAYLQLLTDFSDMWHHAPYTGRAGGDEATPNKYKEPVSQQEPSLLPQNKDQRKYSRGRAPLCRHKMPEGQNAWERSLSQAYSADEESVHGSDHSNMRQAGSPRRHSQGPHEVGGAHDPLDGSTDLCHSSRGGFDPDPQYSSQPAAGSADRELPPNPHPHPEAGSDQASTHETASRQRQASRHASNHRNSQAGARSPSGSVRTRMEGVRHSQGRLSDQGDQQGAAHHRSTSPTTVANQNRGPDSPAPVLANRCVNAPAAAVEGPRSHGGHEPISQAKQPKPRSEPDEEGRRRSRRQSRAAGKAPAQPAANSGPSSHVQVKGSGTASHCPNDPAVGGGGGGVPIALEGSYAASERGRTRQEASPHPASQGPARTAPVAMSPARSAVSGASVSKLCPCGKPRSGRAGSQVRRG